MSADGRPLSPVDVREEREHNEDEESEQAARDTSAHSAPSRSSSSSSSDDDAASDAEGDLDEALAKITGALAKAQRTQEQAIAEEQAAKEVLRKQAISNAREEAAIAEASEIAKEKRAQERAEAAAAAARMRGPVEEEGTTVLREDSSDADARKFKATPSSASERLRMIELQKEAEEKARSKDEWKKAVKNPLKMAALLAQKQKEREERYARDSGLKAKWRNAQSKMGLLAKSVATAQELSADRYQQTLAATLIQKHVRRLLVMRQMGMLPGMTLLDEGTRQAVQARLAEMKLTAAFEKLSPEKQRAVAKLGTQLANMAKENTYNNAAEHLLLCIGDPAMATLVANWALDGSRIRPVHNAAKYKNRKLMKFLCSRGAEVNLRDSLGMTPLHYSVMPPFEISAEARAKVLVDADSREPTHVRECTECCKILLGQGALLSIPSNMGRSPIYEAAWECIRHINFFHINTNDLEAAAFAQCCFVLMELLLERGASIDCRDKEKNTLLHSCAILGGPGAVDVTAWMLDKDFDIELRNTEEKTPFFCALEYGNGDVATLLRDHGCDQNAVDQYDVTPKENSNFFNRLQALLYCEHWPKDYVDYLKEAKSWTGCDAHKGVERNKLQLTVTDKKQLQYLEDLFKSSSWQWGYTRPAIFMEHYNPAHRDWESPFDILDFEALGSLLYYDMMWVQMDDDGRAMKEQLKVDCKLFFVPVALTSWRCTWAGRLLGRRNDDEWILTGGLQPTQSYKAHERGITQLISVVPGIIGGRSLLASIADENNIKLWYAPSMTQAGMLHGHEGKVTSVACSSSYVFTGSADRTVRQWDLLDCSKCVAVLRGHADTISAIAVDQPSMWMVSGSHDGSMRIWHLPSKACMAIFNCDKGVASIAAGGYPRCIVLDEARSVVYCGLQSGDVQMWDLHQYLIPAKRPSTTNRTKPKILLPGKPDDILLATRRNVDMRRSKLHPTSPVVFDTWKGVQPGSESSMVPGCLYWYELTLTNYGLPVKDLVVKDLLETGMQYAGCYPVGASICIERSFNGRNAVLWKIESLPLAKEAKLKVFVTADVVGKYARATRLIHGAGLACQQLRMIRNQIHCGFQGGTVTQVKLKHRPGMVRLARLFDTPAEEYDPWLPKKIKLSFRIILQCVQRAFMGCFYCCCCGCLSRRCCCKSCTAKQRVQPVLAGQKIITSVIDTHYYHKMIDKEGDLEKTVMVTGLDGSKKWTAYAIGKEVHVARGTRVITNYHPITTRVLHLSRDSLAIGYSDGGIRIWPIFPPTSWEAQDMLIVLAIDIAHVLLLILILPFFWRSLSVLCGLCKRYKRSDKRQLRQYVVDNALIVVLDFWAMWLFLLYILLLPGCDKVKQAWRLRVQDCDTEPLDYINVSEMRETVWWRLRANTNYLHTIAQLSTNRFADLTGRFQKWASIKLYGGHSGKIVSIHAWGSSIYTLCTDGVLCVWQDGSKPVKTFYGGADPTCFCIQSQFESLITIWIGHKDGHVDVRSIEDGELVASTSFSEHGAVTCLADGQISTRKIVYVGWADGSVLNTSLSMPQGVLQIREIEVTADLVGHQKSISEIICRADQETVYSRSFGRLLAHSMVSNELKVIFSETDTQRCSAVEFGKDSLFTAIGNNVLVFDLPASFHGQDAMGLNKTTIEFQGGELTARTGKLLNVLEGHLREITALLVDKDSIFSGSEDCTIREWKATYPWECVNVFDSQLATVNQICVCSGSLFCSFPDGLLQGWKLGEGFKLSKKNEFVVSGTKLKATTTETLGKLLRAAKASQKDLRDITHDPRSGRTVNIELERPRTICQLKTFRSPTLDGKLFVGLEIGDVWVLNSRTAEVDTVLKTGRHNSIGWLALEIFSVMIFIVQMVGLGFCIDNTLWSNTGAQVRDAVSPLVLRTRGYHAAQFYSNYSFGAGLALFYIFAVTMQLKRNTVGNLFLRAQFCTDGHVQQIYAMVANFCWTTCWLGTHACLIPTARALAATFDCTFSCYQGQHLAFSIGAALLLLLYVPLVSRMIRVHGDVLRLARGRYLSWQEDRFRDDLTKFLTSFSVKPAKIWCMTTLVWAKVVAAFVSTLVKTPSLNACTMCVICLVVLVFFLWTMPLSTWNGNLVFLGSFLAIGAGYAAAFATAWFQVCTVLGI
eukprot:SAG31_NODE_213_length_20124_cov_17.709613_3_plen_2132_part_00